MCHHKRIDWGPVGDVTSTSLGPVAKPSPEPPDWKGADKYARNYVLSLLMDHADALQSYADESGLARNRGAAINAALHLLIKEAGNG